EDPGDAGAQRRVAGQSSAQPAASSAQSPARPLSDRRDDVGVFDLRYHVASLAAVFFALVIGILVGVALASHGLGNAERKKLQADLRNAQSRIDELKGAAQADKAETQFATAAYDAVMANRLHGAHVAVLFVGPVNNTILTAVEGTLTD